MRVFRVRTELFSRGSERMRHPADATILLIPCVRLSPRQLRYRRLIRREN
jgi:hypothetical protein